MAQSPLNSHAPRALLGVVVGLLLVWGGCSTRAQAERADVPSRAPVASLHAQPSPPRAEPVAAPLRPSAAPPARPRSAQQAGPLHLPRFFAELDTLAQATATRGVNISWFGDSHTAADFLTGEVRQLLQQRFGDGGPGFVRIGVESGRHAQVATVRRGKWRQLPKVPTLYERQGDGVFGLSGLAAHAISGHATLRFRRAAPSVSWQFVVRANSARSKALLGTAGGSPKIDLLSRSVTRGSQLRGASVSVGPNAELELELRDVDVFGAFGVSHQPGVALDTLGINGARIRTLLAWQEGAWLGELAERDPALVVLAFGTNESGDNVAVDKYAADYAEVLERVRVALPEADCLLVGPTDRGADQVLAAERARQLDAMQAGVARANGCGYFSLLQQMTSEGGYAGWARRSLASSDGVHLTADGYHELGRRFVRELFSAYDAR